MPDERTTVPRQLDFDWRCVIGAVDTDPAEPGSPFRIRANGQKFRWIEEGVLDLEGVAVPPGLRWHLPDRLKGMYYLSQIYEVEGTILGRAVRGFIPMDQLWMDGMIYAGDIFIGERGSLAPRRQHPRARPLVRVGRGGTRSRHSADPVSQRRRLTPSRPAA